MTLSGRTTVPAREHSFSDPLPDRLYLDTDLLIAYFVPAEPHHLRCVQFMMRLAYHRRTAIYLSSLTWMEFAHHVTKERFRIALPSHVRQQYRLDRWSVPLVREAYVRAMLSLLDDLLAEFESYEIGLTPVIRREATRFMAQYNLGPHDAVHLASAVAVGVPDLASLDRGFRRVDNLQLWNDRIFSVGAI